jgi:hypothetical protein
MDCGYFSSLLASKGSRNRKAPETSGLFSGFSGFFSGDGLLLAFPGSRVSGFVHFFQFLDADTGIDPGRVQVGVPQENLEICRASVPFSKQKGITRR